MQPEVTFNNHGSQQSFGLIDAEAAEPDFGHQAQPANTAPAFDPLQLTEAQRKELEEKRQAALSKKRRREEMEAQKKLIEEMNRVEADIANNEQVDEIDCQPMRVDEFMKGGTVNDGKRSQKEFERRG